MTLPSKSISGFDPFLELELCVRANCGPKPPRLGLVRMAKMVVKEPLVASTWKCSYRLGTSLFPRGI